ncbi:Uncharacterised protein [Mycobacterium tuberculosis]|nr:Uncharacterised protein [Mycobacterium tuberculosis]
MSSASHLPVGVAGSAAAPKASTLRKRIDAANLTSMMSASKNEETGNTDPVDAYSR